MLWERLDILLLPQFLVLRRASINRWRRGGAALRSEPVEQAAGAADWRPAVAALGEALVREARHGTRVHIALSDLWVRSCLMPVASTGLNAEETRLLAHAHFARQYPQTGQDNWTFRLALQGTRLLAAGMESELLDAVRQANVRAGSQLGRMEPLFSWTYDRFEKALAGSTGWMLLDEPGMLSLAFVEQGRLVSLHCQRCDCEQDEIAARLLERQSALLAQTCVEVRVFSVAARQVRLPPPWRIVLRRGMFDADDHAHPATVPVRLAP